MLYRFTVHESSKIHKISMLSADILLSALILRVMNNTNILEYSVNANKYNLLHISAKFTVLSLQIEH